MFELLIIFLILILLVVITGTYIPKRKNTFIDKGNDTMTSKRGLSNIFTHIFMTKEPFNNNPDYTNFNPFMPHDGLTYEQLFASYGKNLYSDNVKPSVNYNSVADLLKETHMNLVNKNNELQKHINVESINVNNALETKWRDVEALKLSHDALYDFTFN